MIFFVIFFVVVLLARVAAGYFGGAVPFLAALQTPLTWLTVGAGIFALGFIIAALVREAKGGKKNE